MRVIALIILLAAVVFAKDIPINEDEPVHDNGAIEKRDVASGDVSKIRLVPSRIDYVDSPC